MLRVYPSNNSDWTRESNIEKALTNEEIEKEIERQVKETSELFKKSILDLHSKMFEHSHDPVLYKVFKKMLKSTSDQYQAFKKNQGYHLR